MVEHDFHQQTQSLVKLVVLVCLLFLSASISVEARIRHYQWEVKYEYKSPDCFKKLSISINGKTPGPTIVAQQGDTVVVEVKNSLLTENLAIHWHGIRQVNYTSKNKIKIPMFFFFFFINFLILYML